MKKISILLLGIIIHLFSLIPSTLADFKDGEGTLSVPGIFEISIAHEDAVQTAKAVGNSVEMTIEDGSVTIKMEGCGRYEKSFISGWKKVQRKKKKFLEKPVFEASGERFKEGFRHAVFFSKNGTKLSAKFLSFIEQPKKQIYKNLYQFIKKVIVDSRYCKSQQPDAYDKAAIDYQKKNRLPKKFANWMIHNKTEFLPAFQKARKNQAKKITVAVYYENPIAYKPAWGSEEEHMAALEKISELTFPGWDFDFIFEGPKDSADVIALLGYRGEASGAYEQGLRLIYETIFVHEFLHTYDLPHHYLGGLAEDSGECTFCPPKEGKCIMDRNSNQLGASERFIFDIPMGINNEKETDAIMENILNRYPY